MNEPITAAIRLVASPEADPQKAGRFTTRLESTGEIVVHCSRQPLVDGARVLLAQGFDPTAPLTMRHAGSAHDSFQPLPIGQWAGWTYEESGTKPLRRVSWVPFPTAAGRQKAGVEAPAGTGGRPEAISLLRLGTSGLAKMQAKDTEAAVGA